LGQGNTPEVGRKSLIRWYHEIMTERVFQIVQSELVNFWGPAILPLVNPKPRLPHPPRFREVGTMLLTSLPPASLRRQTALL